jgi:hypothetical protein
MTHPWMFVRPPPLKELGEMCCTPTVGAWYVFVLWLRIAAMDSNGRAL